MQWNHSPNSSSPAAIAELIGGHIDAVSVNLPTFKSYTNDGSVRLLAVTGDERDPSYPDVPTFKRAGLRFPRLCLFLHRRPRRHRPCCCTALSDAVGTAMENADVQDSFTKLEFPMSFTSSEDFAARIPEDFCPVRGDSEGPGRPLLIHILGIPSEVSRNSGLPSPIKTSWPGRPVLRQI